MRRQRGQALVEVALLAPVFALLLLWLAFWAHMTLQRLALVQLSRDATLMLARNGSLWGQSLDQQQAAVRRLAERHPGMDPSRLQLSFDPLSPAGLDRVPLLGEALNSPVGHVLNGWIGMRRYHFQYRVPVSGLAARFFPQGLHLQEDLVVMGDPWKMSASHLLQRLLR